MYFPSHGQFICGSRTYPTNCKGCGSDVFYFFCDHGSKVFFDDLGGSWPQHYCGATNDGSPSSTRQDGRVALSQLEGVDFSIEERNSGLLLGFTRGSIDISPEAIRRVSKSRHRPRETMRIAPIGTSSEVVIGRVSEVIRCSLDRKFKLHPNSVGLRLMSERFPNLKAVQLTILVDDIDIDPDAEDLFSYTFLCPGSSIADSVVRNDIVKVELEPMELFGTGRIWTATSPEVL